ncbi:MAG TPA: hypothetical protein VNO35_18630 [Steroidobacteraceae bacterium]|nr:hypothetical protein [Steroidobacteraceae bacterium]
MRSYVSDESADSIDPSDHDLCGGLWRRYFNPDNEQREPGLLDAQIGYRLPVREASAANILGASPVLQGTDEARIGASDSEFDRDTAQARIRVPRLVI